MAQSWKAGQRVNLDVTLENINCISITKNSGFGNDIMTAYVFRDADGNTIVWKTTSILECERDGKPGIAQIGDNLAIKATVKGFGTYKGQKQLEIMRVKVA